MKYHFITFYPKAPKAYSVLLEISKIESFTAIVNPLMHNVPKWSDTL